MIAADPRLGSEERVVEDRFLARTNRERCGPTVGGFLVDEESPGKTFAARQRQRTEVDSERNPEFATRRHAGRSSSFELPVQADGFVADDHCMSVFVRQVETPLMFDVRLVPRDTNSHGHGDLLGTRSDDTEPTTKDEQFSTVHLHGIGHQDDRAKGWGVELEVRLIHCVDTSGLDLATEACP
jgi:hypothetical protein